MDKKRNIKGIIFDFDGVILDSAEIKTEAFIELFDEYPEYAETIKSHHIENQGITRFKKFQWIYENLLDKEYTKQTKDKLGRDFSNLVFEKIMNAEFIPGAIELLNELNGRVPCFISSGTPDEELVIILKERNLKDYFQRVYGSDRTKEEAVDLIINDYGFSNDELLFIGDAITDYNAARSADLHFIAVQSTDSEAIWKERGITPIDHLMEITNRFQFN
jgi:phosphoglycolate phosphatase-like HAD superfamily hydrolase